MVLGMSRPFSECLSMLARYELLMLSLLYVMTCGLPYWSTGNLIWNLSRRRSTPPSVCLLVWEANIAGYILLSQRCRWISQILQTVALYRSAHNASTSTQMPAQALRSPSPPYDKQRATTHPSRRPAKYPALSLVFPP